MLCTWFFPYFWEDLIYFLRRKRLKAMVKKWASNGILSIIDLFMQRVGKLPHKPFLIYEGKVHTYQDVDRSNRIAEVFLHYGNLKKDDTVDLLMGNIPDFIHVWFGLAQLGCVVAFLNFSVYSRSVLHCINTHAAKAPVIGEDCLGSIEKEFIFHLLENNVAVWLMSANSPFQRAQTTPDKLDKVSDHPVPSHLKAVINTRNTAMYIFILGSTGFPKAAIITLLRALSDIMYLTFPLYHISASLLGISGYIELGKIYLLFWNDCRKYNVTVFRPTFLRCRMFLFGCSQKEEDRVHKVGIALVNYIRPAVWKEFPMRFELRKDENGRCKKAPIDYEGRTGMAAIVLKSDQPYKHVVDFLPSYAQPRFVRIMDVMQITATFKHQKMHLVNEGFNPKIISEPLYFMHEPAYSYIPLTREI
uniref:Long-chain-fatty-acid--CoA ligase n=1 Tax=Aquila chrysaetos chrysaetos TaxID=223781 RepID=A0A663FGP7_AQUCH